MGKVRDGTGLGLVSSRSSQKTQPVASTFTPTPMTRLYNQVRVMLWASPLRIQPPTLPFYVLFPQTHQTQDDQTWAWHLPLQILASWAVSYLTITQLFKPGPSIWISTSHHFYFLLILPATFRQAAHAPHLYRLQTWLGLPAPASMLLSTLSLGHLAIVQLNNDYRN